jgi:hypothetical protein
MSGLKRFWRAQPHAKCGTHEFYVNSRKCVACDKAQRKRMKERRIAKSCGVTTKAWGLASKVTQGPVCANCNTTERYASNGACVVCSRARGKAYHNNKKSNKGVQDKILLIQCGPCEVCNCIFRFALDRQCVAHSFHASMIAGNGPSDLAYIDRQELPSS